MFRSAPRLFWAIFVLLALLHLTLILRQRLYPFVDLPNHLAVATIARYYGEPDNRFADYYRLEGGAEPNLLHLAVSAAPVFGSVEAANRAFLAAYVLLLPLAVLVAIHRVGGRPWLALLAFLLLYNHNILWGFVGFSMALPLILFVFALSLGEPGGWPRRLAVAALMLLLFFTHILAAIYGAVVFLLVRTFERRGNFLALGRDALVLVPVVALVIAWWATHEASGRWTSLGGFLIDYYRHEYLQTFAERRALLTQDNGHLFAGRRGAVASMVFGLAILAPVAWFALRGPLDPRRLLARRLAPAWLLLASATLCFFVLPPAIPGNWSLYQRFSVVALLGCIVLASLVGPARRVTLQIAGMTLLVAAHLVLWGDYFADFDRETAAFTKDLLPGEATEARLAGLVYDEYRGMPVYIHYQCYHIVWNRGIASTKFMDYRFGRVRRGADQALLPKHQDWTPADRYRGGYENADFILVRNPAGSPLAGVAGFEEVRSTGDWALYRNRSSSAPF